MRGPLLAWQFVSTFRLSEFTTRASRSELGEPLVSHAPLALARLWSINKIAVPLKRTAISTVSDLSNYQIVFYLDNGVPCVIVLTRCLS